MRDQEAGSPAVLWQVIATRDRLRRRVERLLEEHGYQVAKDSLLPNDIRLNTVRAAIVLTEGEQHVLEAWLDSDSRKQVAARLGVSEETISTHTHAIFTKLQTHNRHRAIVEALRAGLLEIKPRSDL